MAMSGSPKHKNDLERLHKAIFIEKGIKEND